MDRLNKIPRLDHRLLSILALILVLFTSPAVADDMVRFTVDESLDGLRGGGSGPLYHGWATPDRVSTSRPTPCSKIPTCRAR